ncbi:glycosyltransferase [Bythopirellula goksoeyrii]|uniref:Poly-beta-1,6-N-acetyl-D-glucosamine synthase n=1 Tax=Bythopirellula goksoeyrii TaxID=1400387 RepID=A0A5B9QAM2_9BACT|nr:glycosyltransferase [Bythopirellula goksoeyrii]QEG36037.1 Poly-beta-1,6-N-acetyl-D-glucosamine synthase [Bythopirellula goksoeyrii]
MLDWIELALKIYFCVCIVLIAYTYLFYPAIIWCCARFRVHEQAIDSSLVSSVSLVLVAHREGEKILTKIRNLVRQVNQTGVIGEIIVVLDGIDSHTNEYSKELQGAFQESEVQLVELPCNCGKAVALSEGVKYAQQEILVFADVRQTWDSHALSRLVEAFRDPQVGAVSGDLVLNDSGGGADGVGLYWRYEKWLRLQESQFDSVIGVTGAICAVRRKLFAGIPKGIILDDVYWPMKVIMSGYRVKHEPNAVAFDQLPHSAHDELRRKIRTLCGNFQILTSLPVILLPWKNRTSWQFISHKVLRLAVPWALLGAFISSALIATPLYRCMFFAQVFGYALVVLVMWTGTGSRCRILSAAVAFLLLNYAAWLAFWVWILGREHKCWTTVDYVPSPSETLQENLQH